jgi:hypothetical protein
MRVRTSSFPIFVVILYESATRGLRSRGTAIWNVSRWTSWRTIEIFVFWRLTTAVQVLGPAMDVGGMGILIVEIFFVYWLIPVSIGVVFGRRRKVVAVDWALAHSIPQII